jgi:hypothetical protein
MWFGTGDGLNKYDGSSFKVFKPNPSQPARSFQNGFIMGLCEGDSTRLWAVTNGGGLHEINRKTGLVTPHLIRAVQANRWNTQNSVYEDQQRLTLDRYGWPVWLAMILQGIALPSIHHPWPT